MYSAESFYNRCSYLQAIDGNNVRTLNIQWLRSHIGIVSQEPILFGCSRSTKKVPETSQNNSRHTIMDTRDLRRKRRGVANKIP